MPYIVNGPRAQGSAVQHGDRCGKTQAIGDENSVGRKYIGQRDYLFFGGMTFQKFLARDPCENTLITARREKL